MPGGGGGGYNAGTYTRRSAGVDCAGWGGRQVKCSLLPQTFERERARGARNYSAAQDPCFALVPMQRERHAMLTRILHEAISVSRTTACIPFGWSSTAALYEDII